MQSSQTLHLRLLDTTAPSGVQIDVCEGFTACVAIGGDGIALEMAVSLGKTLKTTAEVRWLVERALRKVSALYGVGAIQVSFEASLPQDLVCSIALDQVARSKGGETLRIDDPHINAQVRRIGRAEQELRDWVNEDPTTRTSVAIARDVAAFAAQHSNVVCDVLDETALRAASLNLLLAVGGASVLSPPRLIIARYTPKSGQRSDALALVGKGITFDSGGINVKPYESFVSQMRNDMAGAATVFALFKSLVEIDYERPLWLVIPSCENPIGEGAMRPGSVVVGHRGIDVAIDHTDAEGRLILADALSYVSSLKDAPTDVWCFATLTTAALIAYGPFATPVHFAQAQWESRLRAASQVTGEDLHFFPSRVWHREANRDKWASLRNTARLQGDAARAAGSRNAAHFLRFFTDIPLTHWDIFASCWNWSTEAPGGAYGATGAPFRTALQALGGGIPI